MNIYRDAVERLCKWRSVFAGWQLGTRPSNDPECQAVRDHREVTILLRAETSALAGLLLAKGVFTNAEFDRAIAEEAVRLSADYEGKFPGFRADDHGIVVDPKVASETTKGWRP